jgi:hypothetical protein
MAEIFLFTVAAPVDPELEDPAFSVNLYESADGSTDWTLTDTELVSELIDHVSGKKQWNSALSDAAKFHMIVPVSEAGREGVVTMILPPRPTAEYCTIFVNTRDILGVASEGIDFTFQLYGTKVAIGGSLTSLGTHSFETDANGLLSVDVLRGAKVNITSDLLGKRTVTVTTTDLASIDLASV